MLRRRSHLLPRAALLAAPLVLTSLGPFGAGCGSGQEGTPTGSASATGGGGTTSTGGGAWPSTSTGDGGSAEGGQGGSGGATPLPPTCDDDAKTGDYCGGDKVSNGDPGTLYACEGPGPAKVKEVCTDGCVVAPPGTDDFCSLGLPECPNMPQLKYGLCPDASDHFRCVGLTADKLTQTIGDAAASAGTHAQDGTIDGKPYSAATDISVKTLTNAQVKVLVDDLATHGFAAFFRDPGKDGWPSSQARHIHAIYVGVKMKASLQAQVKDWLTGLNGLASHTPYTFYQASDAKKAFIEKLFDAYN